MIAAQMLDARLTVPLALALGVGLLWYGIRLGSADVPRSRRWVRRLSLLLMLAALPNFVRGLSFLDPGTDQQAYVMAWSAALLLMLMVIVTAVADVLVTLAIERRRSREEIKRARHKLLADLQGRPRIGNAVRSDPGGGKRS